MNARLPYTQPQILAPSSATAATLAQIATVASTTITLPVIAEGMVLLTTTGIPPP